jgi:hypothetical protein
MGTVIVFGCAAAHFVWPPAAALGAIGAFVAHVGIFGLNRAETRLAHAIAVLVYAVVLARATGSPLLGAAAVAVSLPTIPNDFVVRRFGYHAMWTHPVALVAGLSLIAGAWPVPWWSLVSVGILVAFTAVGTLMTVTGIGALKKLGRPAWKVKIGESVPDFSLSDRRGNQEFRLSEQRGKHVLLAFMRSCAATGARSATSRCAFTRRRPETSRSTT